MLLGGGYVFPQSFGGSCDESAVGFTLFLTETWWSEADGGLLELFDDGVVPTKVLPQGAFSLLSYHLSRGDDHRARVVTDLTKTNTEIFCRRNRRTPEEPIRSLLRTL